MTDETPMEDTAFAERLKLEAEKWQRDRLLRPDQAQLILAQYGLTPGESYKSLHRFRLVSILAVLGVILVGIGVLLVIGANWQLMPKLARLAILILATFGAYASGYTLAHKPRPYPGIGLALLLLGSLLWGSSIFLIGQMYSLGGEGGEADGVLYWFIGVLPLTYILLSRLHLVLSLALGTTWLMMTLAALGYVPGSFFMLVFLLLGIVLYSVGRLHSRWPAAQRLEMPYRWLGLFYIFGALYAASYKYFWRINSYMDQPVIMSHLWVWFGPMLAAGAVAIAILALMRSRSEYGWLQEILPLSLLLILGLAILLAEPSLAKPADRFVFTSLDIWTMAIFNLLLFAGEIGLIALGWANNEPALANFGILIFSLQAFTRYFDLFGGMLSGGFVFIGAGLLLVVGGFLLERSRRKLIDAMAQRGSI